MADKNAAFGQDDDFADEGPQVPEIGAPLQPGMPGHKDEFGNYSDPYEGFVRGWQAAPGQVNDLGRLAARGMTFGGADHFAAAMTGLTGIGGGGDTVEEQQITTAQGMDNTGILGRAAGIGGALATGALTGGIGMGSGLGSLAAGAAFGAGGTAAQSYFDTGELPTTKEVVAGTILGAGLSGTGYMLGKTLQRPRLNPTQEENVTLLNREGVNVTSGQALNDMRMMRKEASATGAFEKAEEQAAQYSKAALRRAGIQSDTGRVDPETLVQAFEITGQRMDALAARNHMQFQVDPKTGKFPLLEDLRGIAKDYYNSLDAKPAPIIKDTLNQIGASISKGVLPGPKFQEITSKLEAAARTNPNIAPTVREMRASINSAMEDYIVSTNQPDAGLWKAANKQYANLLIVEQALGKINAQTANGYITPQALAAATKKIKGTRNYVRGRTDFDDLARAGIASMPKLPIDNYAPASELSKMLSRKIAMASAGTMGYGAFAGTGSPMLGVATGAAGYALPAMANAATSGLRLAPVTSLPRNSAGIGAGIGAGLSVPAAQEVNPFLKATGL